MNHIIK